jgi:hypothetical protein
MSSKGNGQPIPYDVRMSAHVSAVVKDLHGQAVQEGAGQQFLSAFRQIIDRLRNAPLDFGEPLYRLPILHLLIRQAVVLPLVVDFAVHEDRPLVFIRGFKVLS